MVTMSFTELQVDLQACHPNTMVDRINAVPGLKTSTAFFTFLRANLVLPPSAMSSNVNTPLLEPASSLALLPPSPSPLAKHTTISLDDDDDIPPLSLDVLTSRDDKIAALQLVADSIAQQRQQAALNLVFHPLNALALLAALGTAYQLTRHRGDLSVSLAICTGVVMTYLLAIRLVSSGYIPLAEALSWDWMVGDSGVEDTVIATRYGRDVIAALVLRLEPALPSSPSKRRNNHHRGLSLRGGKGVIRAWTTKLRYRGKGVGRDMLHEALRVTRERCGKDAEVGFAKEHANSGRVLPEIYNGAFRRGEMKAAKALEGVLVEWDGVRRKR